MCPIDGRIAPERVDEARAMAQHMTEARWTDPPSPQPLEVIGALCVLVLALERRVASLEARGRPMA